MTTISYTKSLEQLRRPRCRLTRLIFFVFWLSCISLVPTQAGTTNYSVRGVVNGLKSDANQIIIAHEEIPGFMEAMTMAFNVKDFSLVTNVTVGAKISFQFHVNETESWVDGIKELGVVEPGINARFVPGKHSATNSMSGGTANSPLRNYKFTNELGRAVSLEDFRGKAIALTFMFTRCPVPEYCPRLARNFQAVQQKMSRLENAPTNWHLLSVTFDPIRDTPDVLKSYGGLYQYDPAHWSFLTGPSDKIAELARLCDVKYDPENGLFNHNFRTLIIDAANNLQMVFPTSGDLSDAIVQELLKAASATNVAARSVVGQPTP